MIRELPALGAAPGLTLPPAADRTLECGLRLVACPLPSVPLVQVHLALPVHPADGHDLAIAEVLAASLLHRSPAGAALEDAGGSLSTSRRGTWLGISATGPAAQIPLLVEAVAQSVLNDAYSAADVETGRGKVTRQAHFAAAQPASVSRQALLEHLYPSLPAPLRAMACPDLAQAVTVQQVTEAHRLWVRPQQALMVTVGDFAVQEITDALAGRLSGWEPRKDVPSRSTAPAPHTWPSTPRRIHQPGWVQSHLRLAAPAVPREDPRFAALSVASVAFGGYFSSRLVTVLREELGLAYRVESSFHDHLDRLVIGIEADTATAVTDRALEHITAQLDRFAQSGPSPQEIAAAQRYMTGITALSVASQSGLASTLLGNLTLGRPLDYLDTFTAQLRDTTAQEVAQAAAAFYAPERFTGVVVGDLNDNFERRSS